MLVSTVTLKVMNDTQKSIIIFASDPLPNHAIKASEKVVLMRLTHMVGDRNALVIQFHAATHELRVERGDRTAILIGIR